MPIEKEKVFGVALLFRHPVLRSGDSVDQAPVPISVMELDVASSAARIYLSWYEERDGDSAMEVLVLALCMVMTYTSLLGIITILLIMIITSLQLHILSQDRLVRVLTREALTSLPHLKPHVVELEPEIPVQGHHYRHHKMDHVPPAAERYITAAVLTGENRHQEQEAVILF
ncbi:hypothetical protein VTN00DRAFT_6819 [Thermoascus crustaceus]|uniref:uncharacterized protein n=1 Tax=Thermoascus crustaceus TaxID=5088 RepID=UPI003742D6F5